ncbi:radical SAM protein [Sorangium sp. So ce1335]|uniref:radical SAM protein n=1 Tax=Sorangium sp. So ce1335 TaxID=3133335 RepID=UPI003F62C0AD
MEDAIPLPSRDVFRPHALDGALLWFHPRTGTNVRWDGAATRRLTRRAPRVALFGITNRCNLACSFCSRDRGAESAWTVDAAFDVLSGLARRGLLEVAFGGGEPLAFAGFDELLTRLAEQTALALHVTTNGTLLTERRLRAIAPHVGEIRVSVYQDTPWEDRLELLAAAGVTFGVNVLATPARLPSLPALLARLARLGCRDVALLRYVGLDPENHLDRDGERRLAEIIADSPVRARLSVCFGDRLEPVPRLFEGVDGDCGAGLDFVTITSDRTLKACSFQKRGIPVRSADDVLAAWSAERERLLGPAPLPGCARPARRKAQLSDGIRIWQGFSGNNSGDCVLVGRFEELDDARRYIEDLLPGWTPGEPYGEEWRALLEREGIRLDDGEVAPGSIARVGPSVMLHTDMAVDDDFPSLRALLWKRGGRAVYSGVHEHDPVELVAGLRFEDAASLEAAEVALAVDDIAVLERRGLDLYGPVPVRHASLSSGAPDMGALHGTIAQLEAIAERHGATLAAELAPLPRDARWPELLAARPPRADRARLWASLPDAEKAASMADSLDGRAVIADRYLVATSSRIPPRYGFVIQRAGGNAEWMDGGPVRLSATFWRRSEQNTACMAPAELKVALRPCLTAEDELATDQGWIHPRATVITGEPGRALPALVAFARSHGLTMSLDAAPRDRIVAVIARLKDDLARAQKAARKK